MLAQRADDRALGVVEPGVVLLDGGRDAHNSPAFRKLKLSCAGTIRWSSTRTLTVSAASTMARASALSWSVV